MTPRDRVLAQIEGRVVDRIPGLGGWSLGVRNLAELAGLAVEAYLANPLAGVVRANRALGVDAMVHPVVPRDVEAIRAGQLEEHRFSHIEPEAVRDDAQRVPDSDAGVVRAMDLTAIEREYRDCFEPLLAALGDIVLIPTLWGSVANFSFYFNYGYAAYLAATALYPEHVERLVWQSAIQARERNRVIVRLAREYRLVPMVFCGHDICDNSGPMTSPEFLRKHYWPHVKPSVQPLLDAGMRIICHCDGDVRLLIDDMLKAGFTGFQGFQYECGVDPFDIRRRTLAYHPHPIFFAGMSVTYSLPFGTEQDVRDEVDYCVDYTDGGKGMFLFTSNVTGVEVPPANLRAGHARLREIDAGAARARGGRPRPWPWGVKGANASPGAKGPSR